MVTTTTLRFLVVVVALLFLWTVVDAFVWDTGAYRITALLAIVGGVLAGVLSRRQGR